jgi:hypothetical protein
VRAIFATMLVVIVVTAVSSSLFRVVVAYESIGASSFLRSAWGTIISRGINSGNVVLGGIGLLSCRTAVTAIPATSRSCRRLRWRLTHFFGWFITKEEYAVWTD